MTGPEHYAAAQRLLEVVFEMEMSHGGDRHGQAPGFVARAQVHATLALAAATALPPASEPPNSPSDRAWAEVINP